MLALFPVLYVLSLYLTCFIPWSESEGRVSAWAHPVTRMTLILCGGWQSGDDQREAFKNLKSEACLEALPLGS